MAWRRRGSGCLTGRAGNIEGPSTDLAADKTAFGSERSQRWFGKTWRATQTGSPPA